MHSTCLAQHVFIGGNNLAMASARSIVWRLIEKGLIPAECEEDAVIELHRELSRRARRTVQTLAALTADVQLATKFAELRR